MDAHLLETMRKLREANRYEGMNIDKLPGIVGDLVRTDDSWRLVDELWKWTKGNLIHSKQRIAKSNRRTRADIGDAFIVENKTT